MHFIYNITVWADSDSIFQSFFTGFSFTQSDLGWWKLSDLGWYEIGWSPYARFGPKKMKNWSTFHLFLNIFTIQENFACVRFVFFVFLFCLYQPSVRCLSGTIIESRELFNSSSFVCLSVSICLYFPSQLRS